MDKKNYKDKIFSKWPEFHQLASEDFDKQSSGQVV